MEEVTGPKFLSRNQVPQRLRLGALGVALCFCSVACMASMVWAGRPNVIVILADDLGASDLGCYGADLHATPRLDQLALEGIRFEQAYSASPVCSPTRASILTGKSPARLHMTIWSEGARREPLDKPLRQAKSLPDLPLEEITLAERLQSEGYLTASVGKWHLGDADHAPETQGFDINIGGTHWGAPQTHFWPYRGSGRFGGEFRYVPDLHLGQPGEYLTDRLTSEAIGILDHAVQLHRPFFLFLAHHAPHTPIEAKAADVLRYKSRMKPEFQHQNPTYAAMVGSLDESVGRILDRVKALGIENDTIVVFTSDNGGYIGHSQHEGVSIQVTSNSPLRSGKGSLYEGGIRVPLIVRWPQRITAGRTESSPVISTDLNPTLASLIGLSPMADSVADGLDLSSLMLNTSTRLDRQTLYFHYPHYYHAPTTTPCSAIREANWKLITYYEEDRSELYNLAEDPGEQDDLAMASPAHRARVTAMRGKLSKWLTSVDAQLPTPNSKVTPK